jgi:uncharacterized protein (TIGR02246 family)
MQKDEQAIRDLVDRWLAATKAGEVAKVLTLMSDDVVFMVPGREPFGKDAFAAAASQMKGFEFQARSDIRELKILGEWAWMRAHLTVTVRPPNNPSVTRTGYTLTILKKQPDGNWVVIRDANMVV